MTTEIIKSEQEHVIASLVTAGDVSRLNPTQRVQHYIAVCEAVGLNPLTTPLAYLKLNGKEVLYATRSATEQMAAKHKLSIEILSRDTIADIHIVYARCWQARGTPEERYVDSEGAVPISGLKGDNLANALMKAATKARRRSVLALMGFGGLDESELETIRGVEIVQVAQSTTVAPQAADRPAAAEPRSASWMDDLLEAIHSSDDVGGLAKAIVESLQANNASESEKSVIRDAYKVRIKQGRVPA